MKTISHQGLTLDFTEDGILVRKPTSPLAAGTKIPAIGELWEGQGGRYWGVSLDDSGAPCHLIVAETEGKKLPHEKALAYAAGLTIDGHTDFTLPNCVDGVLLRDRSATGFAKDAYWLAPVYAQVSGCAWYQGFCDGGQGWDPRNYALRARAVRRLPI